LKKQFDEKLFQAFQANLLSLISHELRTPLTGVMNSINLLKEGGHTPDLLEELISMAFRNTHKLNQSLSAILDVASIESGAFVVRLKEVKLRRLLKRRAEVHLSLLKELKIETPSGFMSLQDKNDDAIVLADPSRRSRVFDLCFQVVSDWISEHRKFELSLNQNTVEFLFDFNPSHKDDFIQTWKLIEDPKTLNDGFSLIAFSATLQTQEGFLSRSREGLGSELMLIQYIMKLHKGSFHYEFLGSKLKLQLVFPQMTSLAAVREVVSSRVYDSTHGLKSLALAMIQAPLESDLEEFQKKVQKALFRSADAAYRITENHTIALVLDDCKKEDAPLLLKRISSQLGEGEFSMAYLSCPEDGTDPDYLLELVLEKLKLSKLQ